MNTPARTPIVTGLVSCVAIFASHCAAAVIETAGYPARPVRVITHAPPGTSPDVVARIVGERLAPALGQPVIVENRPGASGTIALAAVAKAQADGHTLGTMTLSHAVAPGLMPQLPYDTARHFAPLRQTTQASLMLAVRGESPLRTISDLVAVAKSKPGRLSYASTGNGSPLHLVTEVFKQRAGIDMHHVPYKGAVAAMTAVLGHEADLLPTSAVTVTPMIRSGKLRALATTGPRRMPGFPDVPTLAELGFTQFDVRDWQGLVVPVHTPKTIITRLSAEVAKVLDHAEIRERLAGLGLESVAESNSDAFGTLIRSELVRWAKVVREANIRAD